MLNKITLLGEYTGDDKKGTIVGGKLFLPGFVQETQVDESTFKRLKIAEENKWFRIDRHNYKEYLKERGLDSGDVIVSAAPANNAPADNADADTDTVTDPSEQQTETLKVGENSEPVVKAEGKKNKNKKGNKSVIETPAKEE